MSVACKTCDVSESFYSSMSIKRFRLAHVGHEVTEGSADWPTTTLRTVPPNGRQDSENGGKVRLLKILVELVKLPAYPAPVFTITGVRDDLKSAFVQVVSPSQRDQVRETLERGKYLDSGSSETVYVWEPKSISFSEDANLAMSFGTPSSVASSPAEPNPAAEEALRSDAASTPGEVPEIRTAASGEEQSALVIEEVAPQAGAPVIVVPPGPSDSAASPPASDPLAQQEASSRGLMQEDPVAGIASPAPEPEASAKSSPELMEASTPPKPAGKEAASLPSGEEPRDAKVEESYLLVSRSWYIEKGPKNMDEAVRISKLLRPFRWRIEPAYTIGVMVDDILSVETANGEIGGDMTKQVEGAGYRLSRVTVEKGRPVAWFKREPPGA